MGDLVSWSERRRALRVPVRGFAVCHAADGAMHGTIENLSSTGALLSVSGVPFSSLQRGFASLSAASRPRPASPAGVGVPLGEIPEGFDEALDVELKLGHETGRVSARTVRIERSARRWRVAVEFDRVSDRMRAAIESSIEHALRAAQRRPILVIDDRPARRVNLATRLAARGMTPLAPRTPLEAIDLLSRAQLHVNVCLLAPSFGHTVAELRALVADSFPWVTTAEISDDVEATVDRAVEAWSGTDTARIASAMT